MAQGCISELLSCCDTNPPGRNAACMLQLLPTMSGFPSEVPEVWEKFNAGFQSEKLRQKESVDREKECNLPGRRGDTSRGKSSSLSPLLTHLHISRTENPLWCLSYHGNFMHPLALVGTISQILGLNSQLPQFPHRPHIYSRMQPPAPSWPHCPRANAHPWTVHTDAATR